MLKQVALITLAETGDAARAHVRAMLEAFEGADRSLVADTVVSVFGGDLVWHLHFADEQGWAASGAFDRLDLLAQHALIARIDAVAYRPDPVRVSQPALQGGIYRALLVHVEPFATPAQEARWLAEIRLMPDYIPQILNAATGKVIRSRGDRAWSHIWEQEYRDLADLRGPYMTSAYHWGFIDRWFDPEMPERIVDTRLCHSASTLPASVMADY